MSSLCFVPRAIRFALLVCPVLTQLALAATPTTPTITASPAVLAFSYQVGAATKPAAQTVAFKSNVTGLTGILSISGADASNGAWLTPSIKPGVSFNIPASISMTVVPTGMNAGTYGATVTITSNPASGTIQQTVAVTLTIAAPSSMIHSSPASLTFGYNTGDSSGPVAQSFIVYSDGSPMSATISVASAPWLILNPTGTVQLGGLSKSISVSIDPTQLLLLAPKTYSANVLISAPSATNKSTTLTVSLTVSAALPVVTGTWPTGIVISSAGTGTSDIVINGSNFFSTSTVAITGFTNSATITVTDDGTPALTASETLLIPVFSSKVGMHLTLASPLPTAFAGSAYMQDLSAYVAGGSGVYQWSATGLPTGFNLSLAGLLTSINPVAGTYGNIVLTATDVKTGAQAYMPVALTVYPTLVPDPGIIWIVVNGVLPAATIGTAYSANIMVMDGNGSATFNWTVPTAVLPTGLTLTNNGATATIAGNPTSVGSLGAPSSKLLNNGALQVTVPNTYMSKLGYLRLAVTTPTPGGGLSNEAQLQVYGPEPRILAVCNSASYDAAGVAPGELITIFGTGLGPSSLSPYDPNSATIPTSLPIGAAAASSTTVTVTTSIKQSYAAPLIYISSGQIGAMVPLEIAGEPYIDLTVTYGTLTSTVTRLYPTSYKPGIYTLDGSGAGQGAILNFNATTNDYTVNSGSNAALKGSTVVLYITGFGVTNAKIQDSYSWAPADGSLDAGTPVSVSVNGEAATVASAVPGGSYPGVLQVNATLPADATTGKAVPVTVSVGGVSAQTNVTMAIK